MTHPKYIAVSPTPECLCMAALCHGAWDDLEPAGAKLIVEVLRRWNDQEDLEEAVLLVPRVEDPETVRALINEIVDRGVKVRWFATDASPSVAKACTGLPSVVLIQEETLALAFEKGFPAQKLPAHVLENLEDGESDLSSFLRYKIALCLMRLVDPKPLKEAADFLADHMTEPFRLDLLPEADQQAVLSFRDTEFPYLEGRSDPVLVLKERILKVAPSEMSVLVTGETGTGREAVAYYLHEFSGRRARPFVSLNCAGLEEQFLRSELFGHRRGSFTGAVDDRSGLAKLADGGTLFLDEVGEMPLPIQAELLRFLETRRFRRLGGRREQKTDLRLVTASQPGLKERIRAGLFRADLYYRIAEVEVKTPCLADVPGDILRVAKHYINRLSRKGEGAFGAEKRDGTFSMEEVLDYFRKHQVTLERHTWPGNVRELVALLKRRIRLGDDVVKGLGSGVMGKRWGSRMFHEESLAPDRLRPVDEVVAEYVRGAYAAKGALTQRQLAERLGKSLNTVKKILRGG